uniref:Uncharacterized protein n=2 Tax=Ciona intestinalis TaxID=7719 RepID=F6SF22_CIOIN
MVLRNTTTAFSGNSSNATISTFVTTPSSGSIDPTVLALFISISSIVLFFIFITCMLSLSRKKKNKFTPGNNLEEHQAPPHPYPQYNYEGNAAELVVVKEHQSSIIIGNKIRTRHEETTFNSNRIQQQSHSLTYKV